MKQQDGERKRLTLGDLGKEMAENLTAYFPSLLRFLRAPRNLASIVDGHSAETVRRGLAFFAIGLALAIIVSHISVAMLPEQEREYYEAHLDVGQVQLQILLFLGLFAVVVHWCLRLAGGKASYGDTLIALAYLFAYIWPVLSVFCFIFSRVFSSVLGVPVVLIPPIEMRALDPIDPSPSNKLIIAAALTFLTIVAGYLFYLYVVSMRALHAVTTLRATTAVLVALVSSNLLIPPMLALAAAACRSAKPLCEFIK